MHLKWLTGLLLLGSVQAVTDDTGVAQEGQDQLRSKKPVDPYATNQAPPIGDKISRRRWSVTCDSSLEGNECEKAIDGDRKTFWLAGGPGTTHEIVIDLGREENVNAISVVPRQDDKTDGQIQQHKVFVSNDKNNWGEPVAFGTWYAGAGVKFAIFEPREAKYVRLMSLSNEWASIAQLEVFEGGDVPKVPDAGSWGPTIDLPLVPVSGAVVPGTGEVLVWSSWAKDDYTNSRGRTLTAIWDPNTNNVTERKVQDTHHDMFCSGTAWDGTSNLIVTGGNNDQISSIYNVETGVWETGPLMQLGRGYQSSTTTPNGHVFLVGGSWNGGTNSDKNCEVYNPFKKEFSLLSNANARPMWTNDSAGGYRRDSHAWTFGWKDDTVFQAGPSKNMNWYYTHDNGDVKPAGQRGNADDAMSGSAVMFDATAGMIITFGGSPDYVESWATSDANLIQIDEPGTEPTVTPAKNSQGNDGLAHPRVFHTSVVLPDGTVFTTGGQTFGVPFNDSNAQMTPELYDPETNTFSDQQPNNIIRVYHSISLLLTDGRVFNGGGGLGAHEPTNHFDAQIYTPQYLLNEDGSLATRPQIKKVAKDHLKAGETLEIKADIHVSRASLIRYGSTTHTMNTDQRRIPLESWKKKHGKTYSTKLPDNNGALIPGPWMLFLLNDKGAPSVAKTIYVDV